MSRGRTIAPDWAGSRKGHVPGRLNERPELAIGDRRAVDQEISDGDAMHRRFFWIVLVRSHAERTAGNPDHVSGIDACRRRYFVHARARLAFHPCVLAHAPMLCARAAQASWTVVQCLPL